MSNADFPEETNLSAVREEIVNAALPHVAFDGWSSATLIAAAQDKDIPPETARLAFPRGGVDMALEFHRMMDRRLETELNLDGLSQMRIRDRVTHCVRRRIELVTPEREAVRRGASLLALPLYAPEGAKAVWGTADVIWNACGDAATDFNYYSKRIILSSVYSATVLYWLGDQDPKAVATWEFLDRRIEGVMRFEKTKADIQKNPITRAAFALPMGILNLIKAPASRRTP
ncbi:MAG: COQ9 family protein [Pseudomonadota bacterium]